MSLFLKYQNPKTLFISSFKWHFRSQFSSVVWDIWTLPYNKYPTISAKHSHIPTLHFSSHDLHCSDMKGICWPFRSWTLSFKHTQTCILVSHTEWSSWGTQWHNIIRQFNSEHKSFQMCYHSQSALLMQSRMQLYHLKIRTLVTSNADVHTNKQSTNAGCLNYCFQSEFLVCFLSSAQ